MANIAMHLAEISNVPNVIIKLIIQQQMNTLERFNKQIKKLNSSTEKLEKLESSQKITQNSSDNSFLNQFSIRSDKSTKYGSQINSKSNTPSTMTEQKAITALFQTYEVLINRSRNRIRTEFVPTSNGFKYVLVMNDNYLSLSWLHSVQELERNKMLLLYYDLHQILEEKKPKIETLVIEFSRQAQMTNFLKALTYMHSKYHDEDVEKLYHCY